MKMTLIISAKNEEATIEDVLRSSRPLADDILVVDGHSTDNTREIALKMGARVVSDHGKGKGDGVRVGIQEASGDILVFIDADGSHAPQDIPRLVQPILEGRADLVIGSRMTGGSDELHGDIYRFFRMTGSHIILVLINYRWNIRLTDVQNGFRAINTQVARKLNLKENSHSIEQEMVMKCAKQGYRLAEVPSHEFERKHGKSTINLKKAWLRFGWCFLKNYF
jgi:glycosyltransferase involved in cell wall biosynthesis